MIIVNQGFGKALTCIRVFSFVVMGLGLVACGGVESRTQKAEVIATAAGFQAVVIEAPVFSLYTAQRLSGAASDAVHIVIEGDGFARVDLSHASNNPTPIDPVGLRIATGLAGDVIYMARPCQYEFGPRCTPDIWTDRQFDAPIFASYNAALDALKAQHGNQSFILTGFSGGAHIAMRLAAMRGDVIRVNTVAGLLDRSAWRDYHGFKSLSGGALRPIPPTPVRGDIQYFHICGEDDEVIPCSLTRRFVAEHPAHRLHAIKGADHGDIWKSLGGVL